MDLPVADAGRFPSGIRALADYVHAKGLKLGKKLFLALGVQLSNQSSAVGRDDFQLIGLHLEQARDEGAASLLQVPQHADFVIEALFRLMAAKGFVDPSVVADADERTGGVFHFTHEAGGRRVRVGLSAGKRVLCRKFGRECH